MSRNKDPKTSPKAKMKMDGEPKTRDFFYTYRSNGTNYRLRVPLTLPFTGDARELSLRLIKAHNLPCYLEESLRKEVERFARDASLEVWDTDAEETLYGGSVFEKGSETDQTINQLADSFSENHTQFSSPMEAQDSDIAFSEVYHKLIHSSALETLLQLEHTYAMAVSELCKARDNARELMQTRHDTERNGVLEAVGITKTERDVNVLMRQHTMEREACETQWSSELTQLQETQRREYREWVLNYEESVGAARKSGNRTASTQKPRERDDSEPGYPPEDFSVEATPPPLEESFTIHLGAQKKTTHNVRLLCGDPLDLCRHRSSTSIRTRGVLPNPERLQTAMTLYSMQLSALILMVDRRLNSLHGLKEAFADVCHLSTDFHFPDIDMQLSQIQEQAQNPIHERRDRQLTAISLSSQTSDSVVSQNGSAGDTPERNSLHSPTSSAQPSLSPDSSGRGGGAGGGDRGASTLMETTSTSLEPGDFYVTRHSNLSQVHVVLHLVTDETAVQSSNLRSRNPVLMGLKNCLRMAARYDIHNITVPLLLVHTMQPEMTINWCLKRAELVFKCVKGFMLENTSWGEADSRTIQFIIPPVHQPLDYTITGISDEMFSEFCEMLPKVFRVSTTRNLTKKRTYSFKCGSIE